MLWIRTVVPSTGAVSDVVLLGLGVGTFGVRLSCILELRCPVVVPCNPPSVLLHSILPLSCLGLPHILLGGPRWGGPRTFYLCNWSQSHLPLVWNLCLCIYVSRVLGWFWLVHIRKVLGITWLRHGLWLLLTPGHKLPFRLWHMTWSIPGCTLCSHSLAYTENNLFIVGIGPILNKELEFIFRSDRSDRAYVNS